MLTKTLYSGVCELASPTLLASGIGDIWQHARDTLKAPVVGIPRRFSLLTVDMRGARRRVTTATARNKPAFTAHLHIVAVSNTFRCRQRLTDLLETVPAER